MLRKIPFKGDCVTFERKLLKGVENIKHEDIGNMKKELLKIK